MTAPSDATHRTVPGSSGPSFRAPERPGWYQFSMSFGSVCRLAVGASKPSSSARTSAFTSKTSTVRSVFCQSALRFCRHEYRLPGFADHPEHHRRIPGRPRRSPDPDILGSRYDLPPPAGSAGSSPHRIQIGADRVGDQSRPNAAKKLCFARGMEGKVTASSMPRPASARLASRSRFCCSDKAGLGTTCSRLRLTAGMASKPFTRTISSTRSASPSMSFRHGGAHRQRASPEPATVKPSVSRMRVASASDTSTPHSALMRE